MWKYGISICISANWGQYECTLIQLDLQLRGFPNKISNGNSVVFIGYRGEERHITIHMLPDPVFCDMDWWRQERSSRLTEYGWLDFAAFCETHGRGFESRRDTPSYFSGQGFWPILQKCHVQSSGQETVVVPIHWKVAGQKERPSLHACTRT